MAGLSKLPLWNGDGLAHVVIETPRGSRVKIAYDPKLECFTMSRALMVGLSYPFDWGFLPSTLGEDGDPLDAMVIHDAPTSPGLVIRCRIIGGLKVRETKAGRKEQNDRFIAVPERDELVGRLDDVRSLPREVLHELEQFFCAVVATENKQLAFNGWVGPKEALRMIKKGEEALKKSLAKS